MLCPITKEECSSACQWHCTVKLANGSTKSDCAVPLLAKELEGVNVWLAMLSAKPMR